LLQSQVLAPVWDALSGKPQQTRIPSCWRADCNSGKRRYLRITGEEMINTLRKLWLEDEGQDLAEYGLLLILIAVAVVTGIGLFKDQIVAAFSKATSALTGA
jgi:pilus assembly protein Flp/PilA